MGSSKLALRVDLRMACETAASLLQKELDCGGHVAVACITAQGDAVAVSVSDQRFVYGARISPDDAVRGAAKLQELRKRHGRLLEVAEVVKMLGLK